MGRERNNTTPHTVEIAVASHRAADIDAKRKKQAACVGGLHTTSAIDSLLLAVRGPGDEISYCFRLWGVYSVTPLHFDGLGSSALTHRSLSSRRNHLVEAGLGIAVIPSFGVLASQNRKVRITELEPVVTLEFQEISNRGRKLQPVAIEFAAFLKTYIARRVGDRY